MHLPKLIAVPAAVALAAGVAACGGTGSAPSAPAKNPDQAFLEEMVPHHTSAVDMAKVAGTEARTPFVKKLAADIIRSQTTEIGQMDRIHRRLFRSPLKAGGMGHMDGGMMLRGKKPFDRAFVDEMVPHHKGAITMAERVLTTSRDAEIRTLAQGIIGAQKREIAEMDAFRTREYGGPVASLPAPSGRGI